MKLRLPGSFTWHENGTRTSTGTGPGSISSNILYRNHVHIGPRQRKEPGPTVSYCADPVPFLCSVNKPSVFQGSYKGGSSVLGLKDCLHVAFFSLVFCCIFIAFLASTGSNGGMKNVTQDTRNGFGTHSVRKMLHY